jgi:hypothetical protein
LLQQRPAEIDPERRVASAFATPLRLGPIWKAGSMAWHAEIPQLPQSIADLPNGKLRRRAENAWSAAQTLDAAIGDWDKLFRRREDFDFATADEIVRAGRAAITTLGAMRVRCPSIQVSEDAPNSFYAVSWPVPPSEIVDVEWYTDPAHDSEVTSQLAVIITVLGRDVRELIALLQQSPVAAFLDDVDDSPRADQGGITDHRTSSTLADDPPFVAAKMPHEPPKALLFGWAEILDAVGRVDDDSTRSLIARLNKETNGPIQVKQGGKVTADKAKLIPWWNDLENRFSESEQRAQNRDATVSESYGYGKEGEVVPDIGGHVQKRRGKR